MRRKPSTSPRRCSTASTGITSCSAASRARAKHRFETADWHGQQRAQRERIEFYDLRVREAVQRLEQEFQAGEQPMEVWHAGQAALHRPADRPPPAGAGRDLLQHGLARRSCTAPISTTTSSSCGRRCARSTSRTTSRRPRPPTASYYPTRETLHATLDAHRPQLPPAPAVRRPRARRRFRAGGDRARALGAVQAARQLPDPGAVVACSSATRAPTSSARSSTASRELPFALPILHDRDGAAVHRHRAARRGRHC